MKNKLLERFHKTENLVNDIDKKFSLMLVDIQCQIDNLARKDNVNHIYNEIEDIKRRLSELEEGRKESKNATESLQYLSGVLNEKMANAMSAINSIKIP